MAFYRKKPVMVQAFRLGEKGQPTAALEWFGTPEPHLITEDGMTIKFWDRGSQGVFARWGEYVVLNDDGTISVYTPDVFHKTHDFVTS